VAVEPAVLLGASLIQLARALGAKSGIAAVVAGGALLARPLLLQYPLAKDDVFVAAFFAAAAAALGKERLADKFAPVRLGAAVGLLVATKYTALTAAPLLLLAADGP